MLCYERSLSEAEVQTICGSLKQTATLPADARRFLWKVCWQAL